MGTDPAPTDATEPELEDHHVRAVVGASLLAEGLHDLSILRRALTKAT